VEIELWRCDSRSAASRQAAEVSAAVIVRHVDEQGRPVRQFETCEKRARVIARTRPAVGDMR